MKRRCSEKEGCKNFHLYAGRGISVCEEWLDKKNGFNNFFKDMGERPSDKHSIDRKNNELGYFKENCRWATQKEQNRNQRTNHLITFDGKTLCLADWGDIMGIKARRIGKRLKSGWSIEAALTTPNDQNCKKIKDESTGNVYSTIKLAAKAAGVEQGTLSRYLRGVMPNKTSMVYYAEN